MGLHLKPCKEGRSKAPAECGTFGVYENRLAQSGRVIQLRIVALKAKRPSDRTIGWIDGGPGESSVDDAPIIADGGDKVVAALRDRYNVLFVDNRGMGQSNPSNCDIAPRNDPAAYFLQIWPDKIIKACRKRISSTSDPNFYNTYYAVDDLNDVRAALGYPKLVLIGGSYGTYFSLVYLRQHPESVESAVLIAVTAPHFQTLPGSPDGAQHAIVDLAMKCRLNSSCGQHFPDFLQEFNAVVGRFARGPIRVRLANTKTKQTSTVPLSKEVFVDRMREALYSPEIAAYIPFVIDRAYRSDYVPLGKLVNLWSANSDPSTRRRREPLVQLCRVDAVHFGEAARVCGGAFLRRGSTRSRTAARLLDLGRACDAAELQRSSSERRSCVDRLGI